MAKNFSNRYKSRKWRWIKALYILLPVALVLFLVFQFAVGASVVSGESMANTLKNGDLVIYSRLEKDVDTGDVVALSLPSGEFYVKRVVAAAGDRVDIRDGKLYVNGVEETASFVQGETLPESETFAYPLTVPEGHVFVLGDNRPESVDSRYFGPVNLQQITGVIRFRIGFFYLNSL